MKAKLMLVLLFLYAVCVSAQNKKQSLAAQEQQVAEILDQLNTFAARAEFNHYFSLFAEDSQFIGTDATEIWNKKEFMVYAKPHFDKGRAWNFRALKRNIHFSKDGKYAWFDELLETQMKICRGSGVLEKIGKTWKIRQYVLSMTVPNEVSGAVIKIKSDLENQQIEKLKN